MKVTEVYLTWILPSATCPMSVTDIYIHIEETSLLEASMCQLHSWLTTSTLHPTLLST